MSCNSSSPLQHTPPVYYRNIRAGPTFAVLLWPDCFLTTSNILQCFFNVVFLFHSFLVITVSDKLLCTFHFKPHPPDALSLPPPFLSVPPPSPILCGQSTFSNLFSIHAQFTLFSLFLNHKQIVLNFNFKIRTNSIITLVLLIIIDTTRTINLWTN